jgi:hypothetical protein
LPAVWRLFGEGESALLSNLVEKSAGGRQRVLENQQFEGLSSRLRGANNLGYWK